MRAFPLLVFLALAACSSVDGGPSLERRPVEARGLEEPVRTVAPPAPADAALSARIAELVARLRTGQSDFAALLPGAESAARAAGAEGSESWLAAQQLLSALEAARGPAAAALAELDSLIVSRLAEGNDAGMGALEAARDDAARIVAAQDEAIDRIGAAISR